MISIWGIQLGRLLTGKVGGVLYASLRSEDAADL